ncbi:efflux RND transporter permease subunit [Bacillus sp. H2FL2]|uniref:efflux RND transporter permease subunit n=2 Tax=Bacteria TaxID=2 RepID=UPI00224B36C5|nr:efflux RND transporter permease subunit [Bacillus sp. H2FL2]MCX2772727.1 efflux RND transporter permease subunit [Bacillus sp. H2FL2]
MPWLTKWSFANKAAITLTSIIIIAWGVVSYLRIPMEFLPQAENPQVTIVVMGQGTDSKTMEEQVTFPIEQVTSMVKGKNGVLSTTGDGFSKVDIYFEVGTDMKQAKREVQESIDSRSLPDYVSKPSITQSDTSSVPVSFVALTFKDGLTSENIDLLNKEIEPIYNDVKGVSGVQKTGNEKSFISVKVDNKKLNQNHIPIKKVTGILEGQNGAFSVGADTIDGKASNINVLGGLSSIKELGNISVQDNVKLKDIATIKETKPENVINRFNGKDSIELGISKDSQTNAVTLSKEIEKVTDTINKRYDNVEATVFLSTSDMVKTSVQSMIKEVLLGALFATIVIMIFLKNVRSTFITIVSIPISLCITVILLSKSSISLNTLTLGGVAVAVGRLVDDSIVVIENIYKRMQAEKLSVYMIVEATKEVGGAITASTLTTVAVFLPIGLVNGSLQEYILPFALTVTYSLLSSLLVAVTIVPVMSGALLKKEKLKEYNSPARFTKVITWSLNHKWIVLSLSFVLFAGSIIAYFTMPKGVVESKNTDYIQVTLNYPSDTPLPKVKNNILNLEKIIKQKDEVKYMMTYLGNSMSSNQRGGVDSPTKGQFRVFLKDEGDADKIIKEIQKEKEKERYSDAEFTVVASSVTGHADTNITIDVTGNNLDDLENVTNKIEGKIKNIEGVQKVSTNQDEKKTVYSFVVNPSQGNTELVASQLGVMLNRTTLGTLTIDNRQTDVMLEPVLNTDTSQDLKDTQIMTESGSTPISRVATLKSDQESTTQFHKDSKPYLQVTAKVDPSKLSDINAKIESAISEEDGKEGVKIPKDVKVFVGGASVQQSEDFNDLFTTMLVSIGAVFLILVVTFKGFKAPFAILTSLPLAAIGSILGLMISGISVDTNVLLGALMLIGIVVTNAIVLLDRVKQNEKTMTIRESLIEASVRRMRPIIMTAVATIFAMLPLLVKKSESVNLVSQSLAVVVIGGLAVATMLTLIVIPCVYEIFNFKKSKMQRREKTLKDDITI